MDCGDARREGYEVQGGARACIVGARDNTLAPQQ
jgi:hypothetical protein